MNDREIVVRKNNYQEPDLRLLVKSGVYRVAYDGDHWRVEIARCAIERQSIVEWAPVTKTGLLCSDKDDDHALFHSDSEADSWAHQRGYIKFRVWEPVE